MNGRFSTSNGAADAASIRVCRSGSKDPRRQAAVAEIEELYLKELMDLDDDQEGLKAFMEMREPVWQNE